MPNGDEHQTKLYNQETRLRLETLEKAYAEIPAKFGRLHERLDEITQMLAGRPTWMVTLALTVLSSAVVGLLVALAKGGT